MNNEAFQKIVRDRGAKSSKRIAREAVEEEFKKKRKGRKQHNSDYLSDSDEDADERPKKKQALLRPTQVKETEAEEDRTELYRDRAKERREGNAKDTTESHVGATQKGFSLEKKGIDLSLVRREKAQLKGINYEIDNENHQDATKDAPKTSDLPTAEQASEYLSNYASSDIKPGMRNKNLEDYIKVLAQYRFAPTYASSPVSVGVEGRSIQKTRFVFNVGNVHPMDHKRAWEQPREIILPNTPNFPNKPWLDENTRRGIEKIFPEKLRGNASSTSLLKAKNETLSSKTIDEGTANDDEDNDDDDDIFGGLDDYVPPMISKN